MDIIGYYTTIQGDTWDGIAYLVYGSVYHAPALMEANPTYIDVLTFDAGVELNLPLIPMQQVNAPPWKKVE